MQNFKITNKDIDDNGYLINQYPEEIGGNFDCGGNRLKSLKGCPKKIGTDFLCYGTLITSLEDGPKWVGRNYTCADTLITSLEGAAEYVGNNVWCNENKITSLEGIGRKYFKQIDNAIILNFCPIKSHMLGLLLVKNLQRIDFRNNRQIEEIFNRQLKGDRDILECQEELINKGYKDYARL